MRNRFLLDALLEPGNLSTVFQPIFRLSEDGWMLEGLECLIRGPQGTNLVAPDILFEYVRRKRGVIPVDRACIETSLEAAKGLPISTHLSVNVHAFTLGRDQTFVQFLCDAAGRNAIPLSRLTIEIVENATFWDGSSFARTLAALRAEGVQVALDDVGLRQSNYQLLLDVRPDFLKIDRYFIGGLHSDFYRQAIVESIAQFARKIGAQVIAEGVEEPADLESVQSMGIDLVQGFIFSPPLAAEELVDSGVLATRSNVSAEPNVQPTMKLSLAS